MLWLTSNVEDQWVNSMADPKHVELAQRGAAALAEFWCKRPAEYEEGTLALDLSEADLSNADLRNAKLRWANLSGADLRGADLRGVIFGNANLNGADLSGAQLNSADLSEAQLVNARLIGAKLIGAKLGKAKLMEAKLNGADVVAADLSGADLNGANLGGASLVGTDFSAAAVDAADFSGADLSRAKFDRAKLVRANFSRAILSEADFSAADMRMTLGVRFDNTYIAGARFSPRTADPWSSLRRAYTGPKLAFIMMLTLAAFVPFVAKAMFWVGVSRVERQTLPLATTAIAKTLAVLEKTIEPLPPRLQAWAGAAREYLAKVEPWLERNRRYGGDVSVNEHDVEQAIELLATAEDVLSLAKLSLGNHQKELQDAEDWLEQAQQLIRLVRPSGQVKQRRIVEILLGLDQGVLSALLIAALLIYNVLRSVLTYFVGPLREEEERTGSTPLWDGFNGYAWLWRTHQVASVLFWLSIASGVYHLGTILWTPVLVPG